MSSSSTFTSSVNGLPRYPQTHRQDISDINIHKAGSRSSNTSTFSVSSQYRGGQHSTRAKTDKIDTPPSERKEKGQLNQVVVDGSTTPRSSSMSLSSSSNDSVNEQIESISKRLKERLGSTSI